MVEVDLLCPVIDIGLAHVVLDSLQSGYLLRDQRHLNIITRGRRVSCTSLTYVECTARAHCHPTLRDADIVENLELVTVSGGLPLHQFDVGDDVLDDRTGELGLGVTEVRVSHRDAQKLGQ